MLVSNSKDLPASAYQVDYMPACSAQLVVASKNSEKDQSPRSKYAVTDKSVSHGTRLDWGGQYIYICWQWLRSGSEAVDGTLLFVDSNMHIVHNTSTFIKPPQWYYVSIVFYPHWSLNPTLAKTNRELMSVIKWCCKLLFVAYLLSTRSCVSIYIYISLWQ